jgi:hypothetical protein
VDAVREAFTRAGTNRAAALLLGMNYRTLERRLAESPALSAAACEGRVAYAEAKPLPEHGTRPRYYLERAAGEPTCDQCRRANADYYGELRTRRRAS